MKRTYRYALALFTAVCLLLGVMATLPILAEETPRLSIDKTEYEVGDPIYVTAYGEGYDWIALYAATDIVEANSGYAAAYWYYVAQEGHASGETMDLQFADHIDAAARPELVGIPAGDYQVVLHSNNSYDIIERIFFTVKEPAATEPPVTEPPATEPETEPVTEPETLPETEPVTIPETIPETVPVTVLETTPETQPETNASTPAVSETEATTQPVTDTTPVATETTAEDEGCASVLGIGSSVLLLAAAWVVSKKK